MASFQSRLVSLTLRGTVKSHCKRFRHVHRVRVAVEQAMLLQARAIPVELRYQADPHGEWLVPREAPTDRALLYFHGGGYFFCSPRTHRPLTATLARLSGLRVFSVQYRLAPEHRYPAALEDALHAYRWLVEAHGIPPHRITVGGDSAGGGLALALMVALRDRGEALPAGAVCFSPWTDLAGTGRSMEFNEAHCAMFHPEFVRDAAQIYLGEVDPTHPLASPLYADLSGLPPVLVHVSDTEILLDDSVRLAQKARQAGIPLQLKVWPGQPHVWQLFCRVVPEGLQSLQEASSFLQGCLESAARPELAVSAR